MTAKNNTLLVYPAGVYAFGLAMTMLFPWQPDDNHLISKANDGAGAFVNTSSAGPAHGVGSGDAVKAMLAASASDELPVCTQAPVSAASTASSAPQSCRQSGQAGKSDGDATVGAPVQKGPAEAVQPSATPQQSL